MNAAELTRARRSAASVTVSTLLRMFLGLSDYRDADADRFGPAAARVVTSGQTTLGRNVANYLGTLAAVALGTALAPLLIPAVAVTNLRPVPAGLVYRRPFATLHDALSRGLSMTDAVEAASTRLAGIAEMDMQAAYGAAMRTGMGAMPAGVRPEYWRRVLVGPENCAMCVLASTLRYRRGDLNPIHPACDCRVQPILRAADDPFAELDDELVARAHAAARELTGRSDAGGRQIDYRAVATNITATHGEHAAPLLVRPLQRFTGPDVIPGDSADRATATDRARRPKRAERKTR